MVVSSNNANRLLPDLILCQVTSRKFRYDNPGLGDYPLTDWQQVGLPLPSTVRAAKLITLSKDRVIKKLGKLSACDAQEVFLKLKNILYF